MFWQNGVALDPTNEEEEVGAEGAHLFQEFNAFMQQIPNLDFMLGDTLNLPDATAAAADTMVRVHRA
jgi:hypothetical protein